MVIIVKNEKLFIINNQVISYIPGINKLLLRGIGCFSLLAVFLLLLATRVMGDFGTSCSPLPISNSDDYLRQDTAYGYLIDNIDMTKYTPSNSCDPNNDKFNFCLQNEEGAATKCSLATLNTGDIRKLGQLSNNPNLGGNQLLKDIELAVVVIDDSMCLTMPTSRGAMPLACKKTIVSDPAKDKAAQCKVAGDSCYEGGSKSQSLFNFSGVAIHCVKETMDKVFYQTNECTEDDASYFSVIASFSSFQEALKTSIGAALIIYVVFYGFKLIINYEYASINKVGMFLTKFLLVCYFSIGLGPSYFKNGVETRANGMLDYALPFLSSATSEFAQMIFSSAGAKGLCEFDLAKYERGYSFYGLWDAIDCRVGYYLGVQLMYNIGSILDSISSSVDAEESLSEPINLGKGGKDGLEALDAVGGFPLFTVLFGFFIAGNIIVVAAGIVFALIFLSILFYFITHYLVCLITLYVMTYIAPIFVPMALFNRTKAYFDSWLKITISCSLQPAVVAGFIALLLTMYDSTIYKNCQYRRHNYSYMGSNFSTFELRLPSAEQEKCKSSVGYKLLKYYNGEGWEKFNLILFQIHYIRDILSLLPELLIVLVFSIIFYFFSKSMGQFAADITSGPIMDAVTASPTKLLDLVANAANFLNSARSNKQRSQVGLSTNKQLASGSRAGDSASSGNSANRKGGGAVDKIST